MFISDKALTMLLLPTAFMVECALLGLLPGRRPIRRANLIAAIGALTVCVILPVNSWTIRPLEDRFPAVTAPPEGVDGSSCWAARLTT